MDEEIIKLLTEKWSLPEEQVRNFISELLDGKDANIENIRNSTVQLIHSMILENK